MHRRTISTPSIRQTSPRVAIIVPVYNSSEYLKQCLISISKQTYQNFDVFIVNDGSTDNSAEIINEHILQDKRFTLLNQQNKGVAAARNIAINQAMLSNDYDFISFIDSDDVITEQFLELLVSASRKNNSDITTCNYFLITDQGKQEIQGITNPDKKLSKQEFIELTFSTGRWKNCTGFGGMVWKNLFKTSCLTGIQFKEERNSVEDELFCVEVAQK